MKRLTFSLVLVLCLLTSISAGEIDGTGKTTTQCTQNCGSTQQVPSEDSVRLLAVELLAALLG